MSFYHALSGIWSSVREEGHVRFHLAVTNLICVFAYFYGITAVEWAILIMICAAVISSELMNTALERAVDTATDSWSKTAKLAKDAAAGAVLVFAVASILVGICIFGNFEKIAEAIRTIVNSTANLGLCIALAAFDTMFIIFGGKNVK